MSDFNDCVPESPLVCSASKTRLVLQSEQSSSRRTPPPPPTLTKSAISGSCFSFLPPIKLKPKIPKKKLSNGVVKTSHYDRLTARVVTHEKKLIFSIIDTQHHHDHNQ